MPVMVNRTEWLTTNECAAFLGVKQRRVLQFIEEARRLLVLDAIEAGLDPGALVTLEGDEIPRFLSTKLSPHQIDLREVLALAELRGTLPEEIVAMGLQPGRVEIRLAPIAAKGRSLRMELDQ